MITNTVSNPSPVFTPYAQPTEACQEKTSPNIASAPIDTFEIKAQAANLPARVVAAKRAVLSLAKANTTNVEGIDETRALMEPHLKVWAIILPVSKAAVK